jgi:hypothetical protein
LQGKIGFINRKRFGIGNLGRTGKIRYHIEFNIYYLKGRRETGKSRRRWEEAMVMLRLWTGTGTGNCQVVGTGRQDCELPDFIKAMGWDSNSFTN